MSLLLRSDRTTLLQRYQIVESTRTALEENVRSDIGELKEHIRVRLLTTCVLLLSDSLIQSSSSRWPFRYSPRGQFLCTLQTCSLFCFVLFCLFLSDHDNGVSELVRHLANGTCLLNQSPRIAYNSVCETRPSARSRYTLLSACHNRGSIAALTRPNPVLQCRRRRRRLRAAHGSSPLCSSGSSAPSGARW